MKSYGDIFNHVATFENLELSLRKASRGKKSNEVVAAFIENRECELAKLQEELVTESYAPEPFFQFKIKDPKPRMISCASFRDRVVQHALCNYMAPILEKKYVFDSYACRKGKGTHKAVLRAQQFSRKYKYFVKGDVRHYYDSISHSLLKGILLPKFREAKMRRLLNRIIDHNAPNQSEGIGLPIGNLTSQWFANTYLNVMDQYVTHESAVGGYVRYMDDFVLWGNDKGKLQRAMQSVEKLLCDKLALRLKEERTVLAPVSEGIAYLGMQIFPALIRFQGKRFRRMSRLIKSHEVLMEKGEFTSLESIQSVLGTARFFGIKTNLGSYIEI